MANTDTSAADTFAQTLQQIEASGDPAPLVALFADDAEPHTLAKAEVAKGTAGAAQFWTDYLKAFDGVKSTFTRIVSDGSAAALEWVSEGKLPTGKPITYRGVSVLEFAGDKVKVFSTYYDTAAFVTPAKA